MHILTLKTSLIEKDERGFVYWGKIFYRSKECTIWKK